MRHIRNRHVVGEFQFVIPYLLPIKNSCAKSLRSILSSIRIDSRSPFDELLFAPVQVPVMIQVVNRKFMTATSDGVEKIGTDGVSFFRYHLKRSLDSK